MEMTAKLSKKRVLAVYPEARYTDSGLGTGVIQADNGIIGESMINTEREGAEDAAWIDAASLLPEEKEHAPKGNEGKEMTVSIIGNQEAVQSVGSYRCSQCGTMQPRGPIVYLPKDFRRGDPEWHLEEILADPFFKSNGKPSIGWCIMCASIPTEPAPKEGEKERPYQADCICRRCEDWDDAHEPAKVEDGEGLPPLIMQYPLESVSDALERHHSQLKESIDNYQTLLDDAVDMREQLKASLLREKGKDEEIERLRGLLREIQGQIEERPWRYCGTYQSKSIVISEDQLARIKAAVTGEQP